MFSLLFTEVVVCSWSQHFLFLFLEGACFFSMLRKYIFVIWASLQPVFEVALEEKPFLTVLMDLNDTL